MTALATDFQRAGERIAEMLRYPTVSGLHLPVSAPDETFLDEFGFVFLEDGSVGPFYVSMEGILPALWTRFPDPRRHVCDAGDLLEGFSAGESVDRALAVGVYNAMSAALSRAVGFEPPDRPPASGLSTLPAGATVGMVGYFCPLVDTLIARGCSVLILERAPERVTPRSGVALTRDPAGLRRSSHVLCTAATLINDSLDEILDALTAGPSVELIGPSGSGLPDPLFDRGVAAVGGIRFPNRQTLLAYLGRGESWGAAGRKYRMTRDDYPGLSALLQVAGATR